MHNGDSVCKGLAKAQGMSMTKSQASPKKALSQLTKGPTPNILLSKSGEELERNYVQ